jgi:hypothetical protein
MKGSPVGIDFSSGTTNSDLDTKNASSGSNISHWFSNEASEPPSNQNLEKKDTVISNDNHEWFI